VNLGGVGHATMKIAKATELILKWRLSSDVEER
jgi:hypothetical protein